MGGGVASPAVGLPPFTDFLKRFAAQGIYQGGFSHPRGADEYHRLPGGRASLSSSMPVLFSALTR